MSNEEEANVIRRKIVMTVEVLSALFSAYVKNQEADAYEANCEFMFADGQGRVRVTDQRYKFDANGDLQEVSNNGHEDSFGDTASRGNEKPEPLFKVREDDKPLTPSDAVKRLMDNLGLKSIEQENKDAIHKTDISKKASKRTRQKDS